MQYSDEYSVNKFVAIVLNRFENRHRESKTPNQGAAVVVEEQSHFVVQSSDQHRHRGRDCKPFGFESLRLFIG